MKKTPLAEKKFSWNNKSGKDFNHFIEEVEQNQYFVEESEEEGENLEDTEQDDQMEIDYEYMVHLERQIKDMIKRIGSLEKELKDMEVDNKAYKLDNTTLKNLLNKK